MLKQHTFIGGITGSGKTEMAMYQFMNQPNFRIFVNTNAEIKVEDLGTLAKSVEEILKLLTEDVKRIIWTPDEFNEEDFILLKEGLFQIGEQTAGRNRRIWLHLFIDEIHILAGKFKSSVVEDFFTRGKRYGIICIAISQRPALVSQTVLTQCYYHILYQLGDFEYPYFQKYRIPIDEHKEWLAKKWHYIIKSPTTIVQMKPIERV